MPAAFGRRHRARSGGVGAARGLTGRGIERIASFGLQAGRLAARATRDGQVELRVERSPAGNGLRRARAGGASRGSIVRPHVWPGLGSLAQLGAGD
jgi:hypothetical protein